MATFDEILAQLRHVSDRNSAPKYDLIIDNASTRQFSAAETFSPVIAFEGDINNKEIIINIPEYYDRHRLTECSNKELKWKNLSDDSEGVSTLKETGGGTGGTQNYRWEVPADACAKAGNIEISITFYDKEAKIATDGDVILDENNNIIYETIFAWNTAPYSELVIEKTMPSVGTATPAADDILTINEETHNIVAPSGYKNTICTYGDRGVAILYFLVNRYLGKNNAIDVLNEEDVTIGIAITINGKIGMDSTNLTGTGISREPYSVDIGGRKNEGKALIIWRVPSGLTSGAGPGRFDIAVQFENTETSARWTTSTYSNLRIGSSIFEQLGGTGENWELTEDYVKAIIEAYLSSGLLIDTSEIGEPEP